MHGLVYPYKDGEVSGADQQGNNCRLQKRFVKNLQTDQGVKKKPDIVLDYNRTKGGVDTMDQMCLNYTSKRQTKRWPLVIFNNMLDTSILALGVIFKIQDARNSLAVWQRPGPYEQLTRALMTWNFAGKIVKTVFENIQSLIHCFKTSFQRGQGTRRQSCRHRAEVTGFRNLKM